MRLCYIANIRLPTEKAHGAQIMNMCGAFAAQGIEVDLIVTDRPTSIKEDPFEYYGLPRNFSIWRAPVFNTVGWGRIGFWLETLSFAHRVKRILASRKPDIVYGRDELVLWHLGGTVVWETHTGAWNRAARAIVRRARLVVAISQGLKDFYVARGVPADRILVAHDGINLALFEHAQSKEAARARLGLPADAQIVMYAGRLDGWKGVNTLLEASSGFVPVRLAIIGGEETQVAALKREYPGVIFLGYLPYRELAGNLSAADMLVLPNTGRDKVSARFTSPLKLFAYLAAGKPLVVADLPSIREVLDENSAYFFEPDNSRELAVTIKKAIADPRASIRAVHAKTLARRYTWNVRAALILSHLSP